MHKRVLGIIGHPVSHSLSPLMHNKAARELGLPYQYLAFDVDSEDPNELKRAVAGIRSLGIAGVNVTVPHKESAAKYVDTLDPDAELIGAINTITNRKGLLVGSNTDGIGFLRSLKSAGFSPKNKRVAIIGAGGSARAIVVSLLRAGVSEIKLINRSKDRAKRLVRRFSELGDISYAGSGDSKSLREIEGCGLLVQTTPLGMRRSDPPPVSAGLKGLPFMKGQFAYDIIYSPAETAFLKSAKRAGAHTVNGLEMLLYQGSESFKGWTGKRFPEDAVLNCLKRFLAKGR
jgi:shikimate dehydrogenase